MLFSRGSATIDAVFVKLNPIVLYTGVAGTPGTNNHTASHAHSKGHTAKRDEVNKSINELVF